MQVLMRCNQQGMLQWPLGFCFQNQPTAQPLELFHIQIPLRTSFQLRHISSSQHVLLHPQILLFLHSMILTTLNIWVSQRTLVVLESLIIPASLTAFRVNHNKTSISAMVTSGFFVNGDIPNLYYTIV